MKTIIFTLAVFGAALYLGYSQSSEVRDFIDQHGFDNQLVEHTVSQSQDKLEQAGSEVSERINRAEDMSPAVLSSLRGRVRSLEKTVAHLERRLENSSSTQPVQSETSQNLIDDFGIGATAPADRSTALLELAERMNLKAVGH